VRSGKTAGDAAKAAEKTGKTAKSTARTTKQAAKGTIKAVEKSVKTVDRSAKTAVKTARQTAKAAQKSAQTAAKASKTAERTALTAAKAAVHTAKTAAKAVTAMVKATIAAVKGLVAAIVAGGWVAVLIILIVCLIGLLVGSVFGIFFSGEPSGGGKTINGVIREIDSEYQAQIDGIVGSNTHDLLDMSGARAAWKEVLAVYTVRTVTDPDNPMEVATVDDEKAAILRSVFWEMNTITHSLETVDVEEDILDGAGNPTGATVTITKTVLRIAVAHKTAGETATQYGFMGEQSEWLTELLKTDYYSLWNGLLYGTTSVGDGSMLATVQ
jgi:hypothetical protein